MEPFGRTVSWFFRAGCRTRYCSRDADNCAVRPAKARVCSFNSPAMEALATLTTALSVPRNLWFIHSTPRDGALATLTTALSVLRNLGFIHSIPALGISRCRPRRCQTCEILRFIHSIPPARMTQSLREAATGDEDEI